MEHLVTVDTSLMNTYPSHLASPVTKIIIFVFGINIKQSKIREEAFLGTFS